MKKNSVFYLFLLFFFFILYTLQGVYLLDPDFGWHLRMGQLILITHHIPLRDPFSYTMPSYHFVDHEWLTDVLIALLYQFSGISGIALFFALPVVLSLQIVISLIHKKDPQQFWLLLCIMVGSTLVQFSGIRPQVWSWFFFSLLMYVFFHQKEKGGENTPSFGRYTDTNLIFFLPLLFLLWANMHAGFVLGLGLFSAITIHAICTKQKKWPILLLLFMCSTLVTLINPYGINLWKEIITTFTAPQYTVIEEWTPSITHVIFPLWLFVDFSFVLLLFNRRHIPILILTIVGCLFLLFLTSIRHAPFFLLFTLPFVIYAVNKFITFAHTYMYASKRLALAWRFFACMTLIFSIVTVWTLCNALFQCHFNSSTCLAMIYPVNTVSYLQTHHEKGNVYAPYNWGGYVVWQLPEKKDFIDGRMPTWNNPTAPTTESKNALSDFLVMNNTTNLDHAIQKYTITALILAPLHAALPDCSLFRYWCRQTYQQNQKYETMLHTYLQKNHWHEILSDTVSVLYER